MYVNVIQAKKKREEATCLDELEVVQLEAYIRRYEAAESLCPKVMMALASHELSDAFTVLDEAGCQIPLAVQWCATALQCSFWLGAAGEKDIDLYIAAFVLSPAASQAWSLGGAAFSSCLPDPGSLEAQWVTFLNTWRDGVFNKEFMRLLTRAFQDPSPLVTLCQKVFKVAHSLEDSNGGQPGPFPDVVI